MLLHPSAHTTQEIYCSAHTTQEIYRSAHMAQEIYNVSVSFRSQDQVSIEILSPESKCNFFIHTKNEVSDDLEWTNQFKWGIKENT